MKRILTTITAIIISIQLIAQETKMQRSIPKIGDTISEYTFTDVINNSKKEVKISEYKGKWLVLDYWTIGCAGCIASMPKVNKMKEDFKESTNFLLVGSYSARKGSASNGTKEFYSGLEKRFKLNLTVAFDSASFNNYGVSAVPFYLIIDPNGIIRAKTNVIDSGLIQDFVSGKEGKFIYAYSQGEENRYKLDPKLPILTSGKMVNGGIDTNFFFRSMLAHWDNRMPEGYFGFDNNYKNSAVTRKIGLAEAWGKDLRDLLLLAYLGRTVWFPTDTSLYHRFNENIIIESKIPKIFVKGNSRTGDNCYTYSVFKEGAPDSVLRQRLLYDLETTFNFTSGVESRQFPMYKLVVIDKKKVEKLRNKGAKFDWQPIGNAGGFKGTNQSIGVLTTIFGKALYIKDHQLHTIVEDNTNIPYNIDITINAKMYDFEDIVRVLNKNGLGIVKDKMFMKCIVVRDKK